jgi:hypothetical protein
LVQQLQYDSTAAVTDTLAVRAAFYDNSGRLVTDTIVQGAGDRYSGSSYEYDSAGRVASILRTAYRGVWLYATHQILQYDAAGRIAVNTSLQMTRQHQWDTANVEFFEYDDKDRLASYKVQLGRQTEPSHFYYLHYNESGEVDTLTRRDYFWAHTEKTVFYYNEYHNPDSAHTYREFEDGSRDSIRYYTRYYYELYEDSIAIPHIPEKDIVIYPNPAYDRLTIRWGDRQPSGPVYACLYNSGGQLARRAYIVKTQAETQIEIPGLASGVYYLRIVTAAGGLLHTAAISVNNNGSR